MPRDSSAFGSGRDYRRLVLTAELAIAGTDLTANDMAAYPPYLMGQNCEYAVVY